jgi:cupin fold WbuC family metalloprotein
MSNSIPAALHAPESPSTPLDRDMLENVVRLSRKSPRKRIIQRLHGPDNAPLQRMLNAMQPGSYLRPHRHQHPPKAETFVMLTGAVRYISFDDQGTITQVLDMRAGSTVFGVDIEPGVWHSLMVLEPDSVVFETKNGPYEQTSDKDFAPWSPAEGDPETSAYLSELGKRSDRFLARSAERRG